MFAVPSLLLCWNLYKIVLAQLLAQVASEHTLGVLWLGARKMFLPALARQPNPTLSSPASTLNLRGAEKHLPGLSRNVMSGVASYLGQSQNVSYAVLRQIRVWRGMAGLEFVLSGPEQVRARNKPLAMARPGIAMV